MVGFCLYKGFHLPDLSINLLVISDYIVWQYGFVQIDNKGFNNCWCHVISWRRIFLQKYAVSPPHLWWPVIVAHPEIRLKLHIEQHSIVRVTSIISARKLSTIIQVVDLSVPGWVGIFSPTAPFPLVTIGLYRIPITFCSIKTISLHNLCAWSSILVGLHY